MTQESAAEMDRRDEREEREYEAMRRWYRPEPCRCSGDMPGHCPGPAYCPMCEESPNDPATQLADMICPVCGEKGEPDSIPDPCEHPACPRKGLA